MGHFITFPEPHLTLCQVLLKMPRTFPISCSTSCFTNFTSVSDYNFWRQPLGIPFGFKHLFKTATKASARARNTRNATPSLSFPCLSGQNPTSLENHETAVSFKKSTRDSLLHFSFSSNLSRFAGHLQSTCICSTPLSSTNRVLCISVTKTDHTHHTLSLCAADAFEIYQTLFSSATKLSHSQVCSSSVASRTAAIQTEPSEQSLFYLCEIPEGSS